MMEEDTYRTRLAVQREAEALRTEQLWIQKPLSAIPPLEELRKIVLQRNPDRCPKWRFRLAEDLVTQLQPRAWGALFEGVVYEGKDLPLDAFQKKAKGFYRIKYLLVEDEVVLGWNFRARRFAWPQGGDREQKMDHLIELQWRMLAALPRLNQLTPSMMFQPACLNCGKKLTDPASMARWIGPECAGHSSLDARRWNLMAA